MFVLIALPTLVALRSGMGALGNVIKLVITLLLKPVVTRVITPVLKPVITRVITRVITPLLKPVFTVDQID